ncbi:hypothetical protein H2203_008278 [Taxawa tesnikishii (nom. ined.)]|nr:hypothetical protein H2203_008278 [Dothideales sp. JES 119]
MADLNADRPTYTIFVRPSYCTTTSTIFPFSNSLSLNNGSAATSAVPYPSSNPLSTFSTGAPPNSSGSAPSSTASSPVNVPLCPAYNSSVYPDTNGVSYAISCGLLLRGDTIFFNSGRRHRRQIQQPNGNGCLTECDITASCVGATYSQSQCTLFSRITGNYTESGDAFSALRVSGGSSGGSSLSDSAVISQGSTTSRGESSSMNGGRSSPALSMSSSFQNAVTMGSTSPASSPMQSSSAGALSSSTVRAVNSVPGQSSPSPQSAASTSGYARPSSESSKPQSSLQFSSSQNGDSPATASFSSAGPWVPSSTAGESSLGATLSPTQQVPGSGSGSGSGSSGGSGGSNSVDTVSTPLQATHLDKAQPRQCFSSQSGFAYATGPLPSPSTTEPIATGTPAPECPPPVCPYVNNVTCSDASGKAYNITCDVGVTGGTIILPVGYNPTKMRKRQALQASFDDCQLQCSQTPGCTGVTYDDSTEVCTMYAAVGGTGYAPGVTYAPRVPAHDVPQTSSEAAAATSFNYVSATDFDQLTSSSSEGAAASSTVYATSPGQAAAASSTSTDNGAAAASSSYGSIAASSSPSLAAPLEISTEPSAAASSTEPSASSTFDTSPSVGSSATFTSSFDLSVLSSPSLESSSTASMSTDASSSTNVSLPSSALPPLQSSSELSSAATSGSSMTPDVMSASSSDISASSPLSTTSSTSSSVSSASAASCPEIDGTSQVDSNGVVYNLACGRDSSAAAISVQPDMNHVGYTFCFAACDNYSGCVAFTYALNTEGNLGYCYLKGEVGNPSFGAVTTVFAAQQSATGSASSSSFSVPSTSQSFSSAISSPEIASSSPTSVDALLSTTPEISSIPPSSGNLPLPLSSSSDMSRYSGTGATTSPTTAILESSGSPSTSTPTESSTSLSTQSTPSSRCLNSHNSHDSRDSDDTNNTGYAIKCCNCYNTNSSHHSDYPGGRYPTDNGHKSDDGNLIDQHYNFYNSDHSNNSDDAYNDDSSTHQLGSNFDSGLLHTVIKPDDINWFKHEHLSTHADNGNNTVNLYSSHDCYNTDDSGNGSRSGRVRDYAWS